MEKWVKLSASHKSFENMKRKKTSIHILHMLCCLSKSLVIIKVITKVEKWSIEVNSQMFQRNECQLEDFVKLINDTRFEIHNKSECPPYFI